MSEGRSGSRPWHRPVQLPDLAAFAGESDDTSAGEAAHRTAAAMVSGASDVPGTVVADRLRDYVRTEGIGELARLWATAPPTSLPGALYQLTLLREWVLRSPEAVSRYYRDGRLPAQLHDVVAGVADPPSPEAVVALVEQVLSAAFDGSLADALDRASAFCRVVSTGRAHGDADTDGDGGRREAQLAAGNLTMAEHLATAAADCRAGHLV